MITNSLVTLKKYDQRATLFGKEFNKDKNYTQRKKTI